MTLPRVYMAGTSALSPALAFDIAKISRQPTIPNVVVLLPDAKALSRFTEQNSKLTVFREKPETRQFMASCAPPKLATGAISNIENLIVGEPGNKSFTMTFQKYKKSLNKDSSVLLVNPGYGLIEFLQKHIWNKDEERPNLFMANVDNERNSVISFKRFTLRVKNNNISLNITKIPNSIRKYTYENEQDITWVKESSLMSLLNEINSDNDKSHIFKPSFFHYGDFMLIKTERLLIDSCIEPLATLLDCKSYGELLKSSFFHPLVDELLAEQIGLLDICYPFLRTVPHSRVVFDRDILKKVIQEHIYEKRNQRPKMLASCKMLNTTNINQLTGHFVSLAKYRKLSLPKNELVYTLVKAKIQCLKDRALSWDS